MIDYSNPLSDWLDAHESQINAFYFDHAAEIMIASMILIASPIIIGALVDEYRRRRGSK